MARAGRPGVPPVAVESRGYHSRHLHSSRPRRSGGDPTVGRSTNKENNSTYAATGNIIPTVKGADVALTDPNAKMVKALVDKAGYYQLYLDQFFPPAVGGVVNDSVQAILARTATPAEAAASIQKAFDANK